MKRGQLFLTLFAITIIISVLVSSCFTQQFAPKVKVTDGLYISNWSGYTGVFENETPQANIQFISVETNKNALFPDSSYSLNNFHLFTEAGKIFTPISVKWIRGDSIGEYTLYTLDIELKKIHPGIYHINKIETHFGNLNLTYPLNWTVEVFKNSCNSKCLSITGQTTLSGSTSTGLDFVARNNCKTPVNIDEVHFKLKGLPVKSVFFITNKNSFDSENSNSAPTITPIGSTANREIKPLTKKFVSVRLVWGTRRIPPFILIKPVVLYHLSDSGQENYAEFYSPVIFAQFPQTESDITQMFRNGYFLPGNVRK